MILIFYYTINVYIEIEWFFFSNIRLNEIQCIHLFRLSLLITLFHRLEYYKIKFYC